MMNEYITEDFIFPRFADTRGSKVEKLPGGEVWSSEELETINHPNNRVDSTYQVSFNVDYTVDFTIEDEYMAIVGKEIAKQVDEEIIRCLMSNISAPINVRDVAPKTQPDFDISHLTQADWDLITNTEYVSTEMLMNHVTSTPNHPTKAEADYDRAMAIVKG